MGNLKSKVELLHAIATIGWIGASRKLGKPVSVLQTQARKIQENPGPTLKQIAARHKMLTADGKIKLDLPEVDAGENLYSLFIGKGSHVERR